MSRSYRKPYSAITGVKSAHDDKKHAARGLRRKQNQWVRTTGDFDDSLIPHRLECSWNNTYAWVRDGSKRYQSPSAREWRDHQRFVHGDFHSDWDKQMLTKYDSVWPPEWYVKLHRK